MGSGYQFRWRANCASHASSATADLLPNMARVQGSTWPAWGHVTRDTWRGNTVTLTLCPGARVTESTAATELTVARAASQARGPQRAIVSGAGMGVCQQQ